MTGAFRPRDDSAGDYGETINPEGQSTFGWLGMKARDVAGGAGNLFTNLIGAVSPIGTSEQGNMALQVPPMAQGLADSAGRLFGTPSKPGNMYGLTGVPEFDKPIQDDMTNLQLAFYGGGAVGGLTKPKGALGAGAMRDDGVGPLDYAKAAYKHLRYPDETVDPSMMRELNNLVGMQQRIRRQSQQNDAEGHLIDKNRDYILAQVRNEQGPFNDGLVPEQSLSPYEIGAFNQQIRQRKIEDGTLFSDNQPSILGAAAATAGEQPRNSLGAGAMREVESLPMDHASRMARARDMGFNVDTPLYHGTSKDFDAFELGHDGRPWSRGQGVYASTDPVTAGQYADTASAIDDVSQYMKERARVENVNAGKWWWQNKEPMPPYDEGATGAGMVYQLYGRPGNQAVIDASAFNGNTQAVAKAVADAKAAGYDSAVIKNNADVDEYSGLNLPDEHVFFNPANVRSVNATFDPARIGENGLLLSDTGRPSILGSAAATAGEQPKGITAYHGSPHDFDDSLIEILKKYGMAGGALGAGALAQSEDASANPFGAASQTLIPPLPAVDPGAFSEDDR